jgi:hypothetical protein
MHNRRRRLLTVTTALALALNISASALADKGGVPDEQSCGSGRAGAQEFRDDPSRPGAGENKTVFFGTCGLENSFDAPGQNK